MRSRASGLRSEKVNVRLLLDRVASTQGESAVVNTVKLLSNGSETSHHAWEISRRRLRLRWCHCEGLWPL